MGTLVGLDSLADPSRLELIPYARAQVTRAPGSAANPFYDPTDGGAAAGLDLRYRLPRNLTFSASVNPDFGQVEADPAVVNLSAFEVFFPERRPVLPRGAGRLPLRRHAHRSTTTTARTSSTPAAWGARRSAASAATTSSGSTPPRRRPSSPPPR
jgi:hypothetical protein